MRDRRSHKSYRQMQQPHKSKTKCHSLAVIVIDLTLHNCDDIWDVGKSAPETGLEVQVAVAQHRVASTVGVSQKRHYSHSAVQLSVERRQDKSEQ